MAKNTIKVKKRDDTARIVAQMHGVSVSYVQKVRNGERENEDIMASLVDFSVAKNKLIKHLESLVPIKTNPKKYARKTN